MAILKEITSIASVSLAIGENWTVRRCRYRSDDGAGGRLCIATGIHGDEKTGQLIAYDVARRVKNEPHHLHGTLDIYPMLNPLGLDLGKRTLPSSTQLDMNRSFPGSPEGTVMEIICHHILEDMKGADLVLDIHACPQIAAEIYGARLHVHEAEAMIEETRALCPEVIWVLPDKPAYNATLTGSLMRAGTKAIGLEADSRTEGTQRASDQVVSGIFCKMKEMGMWSGETVAPPASVPVMHGARDVARVTCTRPGMYVPVECIGEQVEAGDVLGVIIDALEGETVETVVAPAGGLVFTQRRYSCVYPGTLIARLFRKERA